MQLDMPKVLIGHPRPMEMIDSVQAANFDGGYAVGDMLGRLGHRCIAFFTDAPEDEGRNLRQAGLVEAMRVHGGIVLPPFRFDETVDAKIMALEALHSPQMPTAFAGATDFVAITLAWGLLELGLKMPQHISVIGSNDSHTASQLGLKMTTVRQPMHEIGATAMQTLQWRLEKASPDARPRRTLLTPQLIERSTHGPSNAPELATALAAITLLRPTKQKQAPSLAPAPQSICRQIPSHAAPWKSPPAPLPAARDVGQPYPSRK